MVEISFYSFWRGILITSVLSSRSNFDRLRVMRPAPIPAPEKKVYTNLNKK